MEETVSVVIPIYNTAPYLDRCIQSIVAQTYTHLEIILVNDGSTDQSPQICEEWAGRDRRIRVIHTPNRGQGIARNTGMDAATGEYICFFDSDDYIGPDTIAKARVTALAHDADVVVFGLASLDRRGNVLRSFLPSAHPGVYRGHQVREEFLPELIASSPSGERRFYMSACVMLYALPRLRRWGWRFVSEREIISEDVYSLLELFGQVQCVAVLPEVLYLYCENETSFSRSYRPDRYRRIRHFYTACMALCDRLGYDREVRKRLSAPYLAFTLAAIKQEAAGDSPLKRRLSAVASIIRDDVLQQVLKEARHDPVTPSQWLMFRAMGLGLWPLCFALAVGKHLADRLQRK